MAHTPPLSSTSGLNRRQLLKLFGWAGVSTAVAPHFLRAAARSSPPDLGGNEPGYYRFKIGEWEAVALSDGGVGGPLPQMNWWKNISNQQIVDALHAAYEMPEVHLGFTVLLVRTPDQLVLIDSGCGSLFGPIGGRLPASLAQIDIRPDQIDTVILSHGHGDHFGGLLHGETGEVQFKNARHVMRRSEFDFWTKGTPDLSAVNLPDDAKRLSITNAQKYLSTLKDRWEFVSPGDEPVPGIKIIDAPGHTPGHVGVLISGGGEKLLHIADAAHHHTLSFEHPDWDFVADVQPEIAKRTRRRLLAEAANERLRIFGAHLPFPAIGHVKAEADHFEYVIEPWVS